MKKENFKSSEFGRCFGALAFIVAMGSMSASAATNIGEADLSIRSDQSGFSEITLTESAGGQITGRGQAEPNPDITMVNLNRQTGGLKGQIFGRFLNVVCSDTKCSDNGSTELIIDVNHATGKTTLKGTLNYDFVRITIGADKITVSTNNIDYELNRQSDIKFAGRGSSLRQNPLNPGFDVELTTLGTFQNLAADPALAIALLVSPFVH